MDVTRENNIITAKKAKEAGYAPEGTITLSFRLKDGYATETLGFDVVKTLVPKTHHIILGKLARSLCEKFERSLGDVNVVEDDPFTPGMSYADGDYQCTSYH